jgi:hypothetical protein
LSSSRSIRRLARLIATSSRDAEFLDTLRNWLSEPLIRKMSRGWLYVESGRGGGYDMSLHSTGHDLASIDLDRQRIYLDNFAFEVDPETVRLLDALSEVDEIRDFEVYQGGGRHGKVSDLKKLIRRKSITAPMHGDDDTYTYKEFEIEVLKDLSDYTYYHATRASNVDSILRHGLKPSDIHNQGAGWTQMNIHLQSAVYLTARKEYAERIAETLANRYGEDAVVFKVDGAAVSDYTKIVMDEDVLQVDEYYKATPSELGQDVPHFVHSFLRQNGSIGYLGIVPPKYLTVDTTVKPE